MHFTLTRIIKNLKGKKGLKNPKMLQKARKQ